MLGVTVPNPDVPIQAKLYKVERNSSLDKASCSLLSMDVTRAKVYSQLHWQEHRNSIKPQIYSGLTDSKMCPKVLTLTQRNQPV